VGSVTLLLQAMLIILFSIINTYVFLYARTAIRVHSMGYMGKPEYGR
jgi:hypothetical protein